MSANNESFTELYLKKYPLINPKTIETLVNNGYDSKELLIVFDLEKDLALIPNNEVNMAQKSVLRRILTELQETEKLKNNPLNNDSNDNTFAYDLNLEKRIKSEILENETKFSPKTHLNQDFVLRQEIKSEPTVETRDQCLDTRYELKSMFNECVSGSISSIDTEIETHSQSSQECDRFDINSNFIDNGLRIKNFVIKFKSETELRTEFESNESDNRCERDLKILYLSEDNEHLLKSIIDKSLYVSIGPRLTSDRKLSSNNKYIKQNNENILKTNKYKKMDIKTRSQTNAIDIRSETESRPSTSSSSVKRKHRNPDLVLIEGNQESISRMYLRPKLFGIKYFTQRRRKRTAENLIHKTIGVNVSQSIDTNVVRIEGNRELNANQSVFGINRDQRLRLRPKWSGIKYFGQRKRRRRTAKTLIHETIPVNVSQTTDEVKEFKCEFEGCLKSFEKLQSLKRHFHSHEIWRPFKCDNEFCDRSYRSERSLKIHKRLHIGDKPYKCGFDGCEKRFARLAHLKAHNRYKHQMNKTPVCDGIDIMYEDMALNSNINNKRFKCEYKECEDSFAMSCQLRRHVRDIHKNFRFKCETCGKSFRCSVYLIVHKRIHTGEKPYQCKTCGKRFTQKSNVMAHERIHTNERPYVCKFDNCLGSFKQLSQLLCHQRSIHTGEKPYICTLDNCDESFHQLTLLRAHYKTYHK